MDEPIDYTDTEYPIRVSHESDSLFIPEDLIRSIEKQVERDQVTEKMITVLEQQVRKRKQVMKGLHEEIEQLREKLEKLEELEEGDGSR